MLLHSVRSAVPTWVVTVLVSMSTAVMEPTLCVLLPPPSQAVWLLKGQSLPPELTVRHSALNARGTSSSFIRHSISPDFSLSNTCTHPGTQELFPRVCKIGWIYPETMKPAWIKAAMCIVAFPSALPLSLSSHSAQLHGSEPATATHCVYMLLSLLCPLLSGFWRILFLSLSM